MKILIFGATGMLGHTLFYYFIRKREYEVIATIRMKEEINEYFPISLHSSLIPGIDIISIENVKNVVEKIRPDIVINCIGIIKQLKEAKDAKISITINSLFPHLLAEICKEYNSRLIHISTDCVFNGRKGNYKESDISDAEDLYGRTKYLGEVDYPHVLTLRTSIIGHELKNRISLVDWFLSQKDSVKGFTNAIYTGYPTIEIAEIIDKWVISNSALNGLYHVSSEPISKYELLKLVGKIYNKNTEIIPYEEFKIDRSLNSDRFRSETNYKPPSWEKMIMKMYKNYNEYRGKLKYV